MSILEDLDLMDLLDELPDSSDFDLNDILSEFGTPGLFAAPVAEKPEEISIPTPVEEPKEELPQVVSIIEEAEEPVCEAEISIVEEEPAPIAEEVLSEELPVAEEDDDVLIFSNLGDVEEIEPIEIDERYDDVDLFDNPLGVTEILYEFGTPTDEEGVKLYTPAAKSDMDDVADDVKVYAPEQESTILFDASALIEESAPLQQDAPVAPKAPGFFAKAAAMVMGLFASKKSSKAVAPVAKPVAEENDMLALFTQEAPTFEEDIPVWEDVPSVEETDIPVFDMEETAIEPELTDLCVEEADVLDLIAEEDAVVESEPLVICEEAAEDIDLPEEAAFLIDAEAEESEEDFTVAPITEEEPANAEEYNIGDILFELNEDIDSDILSSVLYDEISVEDFNEEDDVKVYSAVASEDVPEISASVEIPDESEAAATILFDALDLTAEPELPAPAEVPSAPVAPKQPGLLTKAAAVVMSLFASKKPAKKVAPIQQPAVSPAVEEDPFANLSDLFADDSMAGLSDMDELLLELQVEREAELEAEVAAQDAAARLAQEEAQRAIELEAQRLAQEEADAEAAAMRREAIAEEERLAMAEDELFDWIESAEKRRQTAAQTEKIAEVVASAVTEDTVRFDVPVMEQPAEESNAPVYDYASIEMSTDSAAPQLEINMDESSEEISELLEMPDEEQLSTASEETPEEAAARKKKEDDDLHYVPEESTAKTITSHIGKRIGAAFSAFTLSDEDSDREEDLGPELPANKAYRFFHKYISGYRFRLRISAAMCVVLAWISLGLPVFGSLKNPAVASAMCLMLLLTVMLAGADILASGVRTLLNRRPGIHSLVAISCFASVIDAVVIILTKGAAGYLPFCGVSAISMCFAIYGSLLYCRSQRLNFKTLDRAVEPMTISVDYGIVDDDTSSVYRSPGHPEGYIHHSEEEDLSETVYGLMAPGMLMAIPVMALVAALLSKGFSDFFHILASMFAAATSFSALIAFPLPYFLVQRDLYATKAAIAGWAGVREIGRVSNMIVSDRDLFPDDTVSIKSVRIVDNVPPQLTLSYMCSLVHRSGSCLVPAFIQLAENNDCEILDVENFQCHEAGGLSGEIGPDSVLVASHSYMKLQGFRIPARKKDSENALFLAVNGHVIAYIIVDYKPIKSVRAGLQSALRGNVEMIFAARDFNVTPLLIAKKFKSATETLRFPSYNQRYEITEQSGSETATCAAVVYRKSFYSYAVVVEKARYLYRSVSSAVTLSAVSSVMGILLMFVMAITGAGAAVTVGRLLIFMLLWLIPTLALTVSITK